MEWRPLEWRPLQKPRSFRRKAGAGLFLALCSFRPSEGVKKSAIPVILSAAKNLQLFVFKKINADASLRSESVTFFDLAEKWH
jgi:hypothetical protein